jgi:hypothetical protein
VLLIRDSVRPQQKWHLSPDCGEKMVNALYDIIACSPRGHKQPRGQRCIGYMRFPLAELRPSATSAADFETANLMIIVRLDRLCGVGLNSWQNCFITCEMIDDTSMKDISVKNSRPLNQNVRWGHNKFGSHGISQQCKTGSLGF